MVRRLDDVTRQRPGERKEGSGKAETRGGRPMTTIGEVNIGIKDNS
jgi:hypothetical protein